MLRVLRDDQLPRAGAARHHTAIQHAVGAAGVAVVTIPGDVADLDAAAATPLPARPAAPAGARPRQACRELAEAIDAAEKVTIFAGAGVRGAHDEVLALAERSRRRWATRCAARSSSSTTTRSTSG